MITDYVWLTFFIVAVLAGLAIAVDECVQGYKRSKTAESEDCEP